MTLKRSEFQNQPPEKEHHYAEREDAPCVAGAKSIREALGGSLHVLGVLNESYDLLKGAFAGRSDHTTFQNAPEIDCPRESRIADRFGNWNCFSSEVGFVAGTFTLDHLHVCWNLLPGRHENDHSGNKLLHGKLTLNTSCEHSGSLGSAMEKGIDRLFSASHGKVLHGPRGGKKEEKECSLPPCTDQRSSEGHREHQKMHIKLTLANPLPCIACCIPTA